MQIYLPIAEMSVNLLVILTMGGAVGLLSGIFGVGGGFLMTPLLMFIGIPPSVAVGTSANQVAAASVSGVITHWRRGNVDLKMGLVLQAGGFAGSAVGVVLFRLLRGLGHIDLTISLSYVLFLGIVGCTMFSESLGALLRKRRGAPVQRGPGRHTWVQRLPLKTRFRRSKLYISALLPIGVGFAVGVLAAIMGVGGGFVMVPAMIYVLGMPAEIVVGTSLFQIIFVAANTTFMQAVLNNSVDAVLALVLIAGGVVGAQFGARLGSRLRAEQMRILLAVIVLTVCGKLAYDLVAVPDDLYSLGSSLTQG